MEKAIVSVDLGFIGLNEDEAKRKAEKLEAMLNHDSEGHEIVWAEGRFLRVEAYNYINNHGVMVVSNVHEDEEHLKERIFSRLLWNI